MKPCASCANEYAFQPICYYKSLGSSKNHFLKLLQVLDSAIVTLQGSSLDLVDGSTELSHLPFEFILTSTLEEREPAHVVLLDLVVDLVFHATVVSSVLLLQTVNVVEVVPKVVRLDVVVEYLVFVFDLNNNRILR